MEVWREILVDACLIVGITGAIWLGLRAMRGR